NDPQPDICEVEFVENPFHTKLEVENTDKRSFNEIEKSTFTSASASTVPEKPQIEITPENCFFCLPISKGPLKRLCKNLPFSRYAIIIPIEHIPTIRKNKVKFLNGDGSDDIKDSSLYKEIESFKHTLINRVNNIHHHVQMLPIPSELLKNAGNSENKFTKVLNEKTKINK
ncbi:unnamed protein product, partial [Rotaria sordida]